MSLCLIQDIDVLGKENDFPDVSGQLRRVVRRHDGFSATDLAHQGKDIVAAVVLLSLFNLGGGDQTNQVLVNALDGSSSSGDHAVILLQQARSESSLGITNRATRFTIEFNRDIRNASGRNVLRDILLSPAHNTHGDNGFSCFLEESLIPRAQTSGF